MYKLFMHYSHEGDSLGEFVCPVRSRVLFEIFEVQIQNIHAQNIIALKDNMSCIRNEIVDQWYMMYTIVS